MQSQSTACSLSATANTLSPPSGLIGSGSASSISPANSASLNSNPKIRTISEAPTMPTSPSPLNPPLLSREPSAAFKDSAAGLNTSNSTEHPSGLGFRPSVKAPVGERARLSSSNSRKVWLDFNSFYLLYINLFIYLLPCLFIYF
jgi:hypothetical protein